MGEVVAGGRVSVERPSRALVVSFGDLAGGVGRAGALPWLSPRSPRQTMQVSDMRRVECAIFTLSEALWWHEERIAEFGASKKLERMNGG